MARVKACRVDDVMVMLHQILGKPPQYATSFVLNEY